MKDDQLNCTCMADHRRRHSHQHPRVASPAQVEAQLDVDSKLAPRKFYNTQRPFVRRHGAVVSTLIVVLLLALAVIMISRMEHEPVWENPKPRPPSKLSISYKQNDKFRDINAHPIVRRANKLDPNVKYLGYYTHSGYHNQRIALENAITLAKMLNRTLLLPPVRFGPAIPYIWYDKLDFRLAQSTKLGFERCKAFSEYHNLPRECIDYFDWTNVGWDLLVDLEHVEKDIGQPLVDRWNSTMEWLYEELDIRDKDVYAFKDVNVYNYRFFDSPDDDEPLEKFQRRVELDELRALDQYKVLHVGTLFGTSRLRTVKEANWEIRSSVRQAMVFSNNLLDRIADRIVERLGGPSKFYAVHVRIGDGVFLQNAKQNAELIFTQLLQKLKFPDALIQELLEIHASSPSAPSEQPMYIKVGPPKVTAGLGKRAVVPQPDATMASAASSAQPSSTRKPANSRPQRPGALHHAWPPAIKPFTDRESSPLHPSMSCRGPLYDDPYSITSRLNVPLYLATDSALPSSDPVLSLFFKAFPCTFILSDFGPSSPVTSTPVVELDEMESWRNEADHVQLAPFLYPIVDMMISSQAYHIIGTPQSTFSRFAVDVLYQAYHGWPIVERGSMACLCCPGYWLFVWLSKWLLKWL